MLVPELQNRGHGVLLVDLPAGVNEFAWEDYRAAILAACAGAHDVTVVATSMSCIFLPLVAESDRIGKMIYVCGMIAPLGISPMEMVRREISSMFNPEWVGKDPTRDPAVAREFLFHDCSPEVQKWALGTLRLMVPKRVLNEPVPIKAWPKKPSDYIVCSEDRTIKPEWSRHKVREALGIEPLELPGGHCPHVSRPAALAELLHRLA